MTVQENFICCVGHKIQGETWEETEEKTLENINSCCCVSQLKDSRLIFKSMIEHIKQSQLFFRCESNNHITKISVSLREEEFMSILVKEKILTVSEDMQTEISVMLQELCEKAIDCINKRIPVIEDFVEIKKEKKKSDSHDDILSTLVMITGVIFAAALYMIIDFFVK